MTETTIPPVGRSYLAELGVALTGLPADVRDEIIAGITEELRGLDPVVAAERIRELGDPEFIAAEARAEAGISARSTNGVGPIGDAGSADGAGSGPSAERVEAKAGEPRWYPVLASLLVAFGGIVIPVIGWVVGVAMVWMSKAWRPWEKWVGTVLPLAASALAAVIPFAFALVAPPLQAQRTPNPLVPSYYDSFAGALFGTVAFGVVAGIWLLWRAKRVWSAGESGPAAPPAPLKGVETDASRSRWYQIVTVMLLVIGGYLVPLLGWVLGVVMLWASDAWGRREKWAGTLAGPAVIAAAAIVVLITRLAVGVSTNLLWWHLVLICGVALPFIANLAAGVWLLRRGR